MPPDFRAHGCWPRIRFRRGGKCHIDKYQIEKDARIDRAMQEKARKLQKEQTAYRQMNENIGMRIQTFQRTLADKLDKANQLTQYSERLQGMQTRDQEISDVKLQQMGDM